MESKQSFEKEIESGFTIQELEQRLEMEFWCCDYDPDRGHDTSCGWSF